MWSLAVPAGSWTTGFAKPAMTFLRRTEVAGRPAALFITHGANDDLPELSAWLDNCVTAASQLQLVGVFHCQGELSEQMAQKMLFSKDERVAAWAKTRESGIGQPDAASLSAGSPTLGFRGAAPIRRSHSRHLLVSRVRLAAPSAQAA